MVIIIKRLEESLAFILEVVFFPSPNPPQSSTGKDLKIYWRGCWIVRWSTAWRRRGGREWEHGAAYGAPSSVTLCPCCRCRGARHRFEIFFKNNNNDKKRACPTVVQVVRFVRSKLKKRGKKGGGGGGECIRSRAEQSVLICCGWPARFPFLPLRRTQRKLEHCNFFFFPKRDRQAGRRTEYRC